MKYLLKQDLAGFYKFINDNCIHKWCIFDDSIKNRYEYGQNGKQFLAIKNLADTKKINYNQAEIISWLDSMIVLAKSLNKLEPYDDTLEYNLMIIAELHMPLTNKRADYVLFKDNKILIIEFSYAKSEDEAQRYNFKLNQVMQYKEILQSLLPKTIEIGTYTCILAPNTEDENHSIASKNLFLFMKNFFITQNLNALEEFKNMESKLLNENFEEE